MNPKIFSESYEYDVESDFSIEGIRATWADTKETPAHRFWGAEHGRIILSIPKPTEHDGRETVIGAVSSDNVLLATAVRNIITIYDVETKKQLGEFRRPLPQVCQRLIFVPKCADDELYQLVSQVPEVDKSSEGHLFFWHINRKGARPDKEQEDHLDISELASRSLCVIKPVLKQLHDVDSSSSLLENVLQDYTSALGLLDSKIQARTLTSVVGSIASSSQHGSLFSPNRQLMLLKLNNKTTQHGMRPPADLPQIVVYDLKTHVPRHILRGHEDCIMWATFSPDGQTVASASWDQTFRLWNVASGSCTHIIGPTGSQNWRGAWSTNSEHVLLSGMAASTEDGVRRSQPTVAVYARESGEEVARFEHEGLKSRAMEVAWCPVDNIIAISSRCNVWIWLPFQNTVTSSFQVKTTSSLQQHFAGVTALMWTTDGRKLIVKSGGGTLEVWDRFDNVKWRFQRPDRTPMSLRGNHTHVNEDVLQSLDSDGVVRFWRL